MWHKNCGGHMLSRTTDSSLCIFKATWKINETFKPKKFSTQRLRYELSDLQERNESNDFAM